MQLRVILFVSFLVLITPTNASRIPPCPDVHTWHNITALHGQWTGTLAAIHEGAVFMFSNCTAMPPGTQLLVDADTKSTFGFRIPAGSHDDFDVGYTLSMFRVGDDGTSQQPQQHDTRRRLLFASMACVYVISAAGPSVPSRSRIAT